MPSAPQEATRSHIMMTYVLMVMLPGLILGGLATIITKSTFARYAKVGASSGMTGAQAARRMLDRARAEAAAPDARSL